MTFGTRPPEDTPTPKPPVAAPITITPWGQPLDPSGLPKPPSHTPPPVTMPMSQPTQAGPPPSKPLMIRSMALGLSLGAEVPQLPAGVASRGSNWVSYMGGLMPRPGLSLVSSLRSNPKDFLISTQVSAPGWVGELIDVSNLRYLYLINGTPLFYSGGSWTTTSRSTGTTPTITTNTPDVAQYYRTVSSNYELAVAGDAQASYSFTNGGTYSNISGAPAANYVTAFDDRLVFASELSFAGSASINPQRVRWSAPANPDLYDAPQGGAQDLESGKGPITRIIAAADRLIVFFANEIWQGLRAPFPFGFQFTPLDSQVGTRFSWSITQTPLGVAFLGSDFRFYIIPSGSTPVPIASDVVRLIQESVPTSANNNTSVNAQYVEAFQSLLVTYQSRENNGNQGVLVHLDSAHMGQIDPMGFDVGSNFSVARLGYTSMASNQVNQTGGQQRVLMASAGTGFVVEFNSNATNDLGVAIDCRRFIAVPNPDPTTKLHVREVRLDYRNASASASSLSLRMSPDFGSTFPVDTALALPQAPFSAQTKLGVSMVATYPGIEVRHASGQTFVIQGLSAIVEGVGNG